LFALWNMHGFDGVTVETRSGIDRDAWRMRRPNATRSSMRSGLDLEDTDIGFSGPSARKAAHMKLLKLATLAALGFALVAWHGARAASDQQNLVDEARITLDHLKTDQEFGNASDLLKRAQGVLIVPNLVKAGFFLGGEGGDGVMFARARGGGGWSDPAFYTLASASFGLQIGIESAEVVFLVMSDRGLRALEQDEFKFGAQAGLAVVTLGANAQMASSTALDTADIIVWASASGAYAGLTLEGSIVKPRDSYNEAYYGREIEPTAIFAGQAHNPGADAVKRAL
jgi:lipid-binding SYLF domain-containing protein